MLMSGYNYLSIVWNYYFLYFKVKGILKSNVMLMS